MVYWKTGAKYEINELHELRAKRGSAIHLIITDILDYTFKHDPQFETLESWVILEIEKKIYFEIPGFGDIDGTYDARVQLTWPDRIEVVIVDLKNYARIPTAPYESNVWQVQLYIEGCNDPRNRLAASAGYVVYFPDSGAPVAFRVERDKSVLDLARDFFSGVDRSVEGHVLPERLDYSDRRCGWCRYWDTCWGLLAEDIEMANKKSPPPPLESMEDELAEDIVGIIATRKNKNDLSDLEKRMKDSIIQKMIAAGVYQLTLPGGEVFSLKKISTKNGQSYYKLE